MRDILLAVSFLTRVPLRVEPGPGGLARSVRWFPLVGLAVGGAVGAVLAGAGAVLPGPAAAVVAVAFGMLLTGALHEDGLADAFDGLGGGRSPGQALEIMEDSRIGTFGSAALTLSLLLRVVLLTEVLALAPLLIVPLAHSLSRAAAIGVMVVAPPARPHGLGMAHVRELRPLPVVLSLLATIVLVAAVAGPDAAPLVAAAFAFPALVAWWSLRRLGGVTGDVLGACQQVSELGILTAAVMAW